ncbi:MAG: metallophosphoesterase [Planctomycetota bacterium]|nr:MAG: metallophosphoesterase [Planctomycetota bacterium]
MKQKSLPKLIGVIGLCAVFYLAGCAGPGWKFIVTGDSRDGDNGVNTVILGELADEIADRQVDFVLISGDLVTGYNDQAALQSQLNTWIKTMQPVYDAGIGVYPVRGNHDLGEPAGVTAWNNTFKGAYALPDNGPAGEKLLTYSFTHKNVLVIGLDQYIRERQVNQAWLDMQLAANTQPHIFLFGHEPAFKTQHTACLDDWPAERDSFWASIEKAGGRTYFCGHDHLYNHARVDDDGEPSNDIHQYIVGTAGAPLRKWVGKYDGVNNNYTVENIYDVSAFGYCLVEVNGLDVTITWFERTGKGKYKAKEVWSYTASGVHQR